MSNDSTRDERDDNATEFEEFLDDLDGSASLSADGDMSGDTSGERDTDTVGTSGEDGDDTSVDSELDVVNRELQQFKDIALRLQADFENYRKRVAAQQSDEVERATGRIVESLLPVLDACEAAFAHGADGVEPIWSQLMGVLQKQGLEALDLTDKPFDPTVADAVVHEPGDATEPVVSEVLRTGYRWKGKVLRPAMVKVKG